MWDPYGEFQSSTLPNGLTIHATHWPERPWEAIGFVVHSGAEQDPVGLEGVAHFVEHLICQNASMPEKDISAFFRDCGGNVNLGSTSHMCTKYHFFVPADRVVLTKAFSLFGQMLLSEKMEKFVERERQVIIGEFRRSYPVKFNLDLDVRKVKAVFAGYWLERFVTPLGNPESVGRITQPDLQAYYDSHYTPANISVVGVGGLKLAELIEILSESPLTAKKKGVRVPIPPRAKEIRPPLETRHVFEYSKHVSMTTPVYVGSYLSVAAIPGNVNTAIRILKLMLDEILDDEVRQSRAWAYDIHCSWYDFRHFHEFAIGCGAVSLKAIDTIEDVVEMCIASLTDSEDLFLQAKKREIANNLMTDPRGRGIRDASLNDLADCHRIISLTEYGREMEALQMSDIRNLLKWIRPEQRWTLVRKP